MCSDETLPLRLRCRSSDDTALLPSPGSVSQEIQGGCLACGCNSSCGRGWRLGFGVDIGRFREKRGGGCQRERERERKGRIQRAQQSFEISCHDAVHLTRFSTPTHLSVKEENGRNLRMQPCCGPVPSPGFQEGGIVTALFCIWLGTRRARYRGPGTQVGLLVMAQMESNVSPLSPSWPRQGLEIRIRDG